MNALTNVSDADLAARVHRLRHEQLRRAGKSHSCDKCGDLFYARMGALYCSGACRIAAYRARERAQRTSEAGTR